MVNVIFMVGKKINMRNYSITKNKGEQWNAEVTDKYGNKYQNWFETYWDSGVWILYIWENEDDFHNVDKDSLLANAIHKCILLDLFYLQTF